MRNRLARLPQRNVVCHGCEIAGDQSASVLLPSGWSANQYNGDGKYLGWLALQPIRHVMEFAHLNVQELRSLGPNIHCLERALRNYFAERLVRLYIVYFFEYPGEGYHLHLHLIPRLNSFGILGWEAWRAVKDGRISTKYLIKNRDDPKVARLMNHLRSDC
jgi:diadenosine tetraphosphate (Ap4A) HIT family hydrolase